nr:hypothetical protein [Tanacetum cinerariifolium]
FTNSVIQVGPSSSITAVTSFPVMDLVLTTLTSTCLDKCAKLVDAILLRASAFLFLLRGTWLIEKDVPENIFEAFLLQRPLITPAFPSDCTNCSISSGQIHDQLFLWLASFPLRLWTSLIVCGDGSYSTAVVLSGHGLIPSGVITYPRNTPSANPKEHFLGLSFILILRSVWKVFAMSLTISVSV